MYFLRPGASYTMNLPQWGVSDCPDRHTNLPWQYLCFAARCTLRFVHLSHEHYCYEDNKKPPPGCYFLTGALWAERPTDPLERYLQQFPCGPV